MLTRRDINCCEENLVISLKKRNQVSFTYLYDNYSGALYAIVLQIVCDRQLAGDVLQDLFVKIWRNIERYDPTKARLFTWMSAIATNLAIDTVRSRQFKNCRKTDSILERRYVYTIESATQLNVNTIGLRRMVGILTPQLRIFMDLAYFKGYTHLQIAELTNIPLGTVKTGIRTALKQLRAYLSREAFV